MDDRILAITIIFITYVIFTDIVKAEADDSVAMLKLASALHGAPKGWSTKNGSNYCNWDGVKCDEFSHRVIRLSLSNRNLSGILPPELSTMSQLQYLGFGKNNLSGPLPSLANLNFLQELYLGSNSFNSIPPDFFQGLTSLKAFSISQNLKLRRWFLPNELVKCKSLEVLEARYANILGTIPDIFYSLSSLRDLDLSYNFLNGTLPMSFMNCTIQNLWINSYFDTDEGLSGSIDVFASMTQLRQAYLRNNYFSGSIPDLSNCNNLFSLDLSTNDLTGPVPVSLVSHPTLKNASLSYNFLQGPMPRFPTNMTVELEGNNFCKQTEGTPCDPMVTTFLNIAGALQYPLVLAQNWQEDDACDFSVFVNCDSQRRVIIVNLACQNLSGTMSQDFCNLTDVRSLMLNDNNLTGSIPDCLTKLPNLQMLDISSNNLSGRLPSFSSVVKVYAKSNPFLKVLEGSEIEQKKSTNGRKKVFMIVAVVVSVFLSVTLCTLFTYKYKKRTKAVNGIEYCSDDDGLLRNIQSKDNGDGRNVVTSIKFLRRVTNNFSEANILGRGGSGVVYKGELEDGTCIAVKRMEATKEIRGFQAEIKVLTRVRHRRLVALLGYCINSNEKILIYEYMPLGTLRQHLFEWHEHGFLPLTWGQRVTIALDVARGVEYLHSLAQETFIHRDLKPSNILLGNDMRAKVADFGLVKEASDGRYSTETKVAGTFGYLAPEYAATGKVTTKVDMYAFGVVLMEMITGRKAVDDTLSENGWMCMHLVTWFRILLTKKEDISSVIDKSINPDEETLLNVTKVAELAGHCTSSEPHQRPDMSHVVNTLAYLVEQWTPPSPEEQVASDNNIHLFDGKNIQLNLQFLKNMQVAEDDSTTFSKMSYC